MNRELRFHRLDVIDVLDLQAPLLAIEVDGLLWLAVIIALDAREQCGMRPHGSLNRLAQALDVETLVQDIDVWKIVTGFASMIDTLDIEAILRFA